MNNAQILNKKDVAIHNKFLEVKQTYGDEYHVSIEVLNAYDATYLLDNMARNRKPKGSNLKIIQQSLRSEGWIFPSMIVISNDGMLLDGQHRMICLEECLDIEAMFVVAWNAPHESMYHIDTGVGRSNSDVLTILGYDYGNAISAVLNGIFFGNKLEFHKKNMKSALLKRSDYPMIKSGAYLTVPSTRLEKIYLEHRLVIDPIIKIFNSYRQQRVCFPLFLLGVFIRAYKGRYCDLAVIDKFFQLYYDGVNVGFSSEENAPIKLRNKLSESSKHASEYAKIAKYQQTEKALRYFIDGKTLGNTSLTPSGLSKFEFFCVPEFDFIR